MRDYTFDDIMEEVYPKFPMLPKVIVRKIVKHMLTIIFKTMHKSKASVALHNSSISRLYHPIDFKALNYKGMDLDETQESVGKISSKFLSFLHAKRSPRHRIRGSNGATFVYHRRISSN